MKPERLFLGYHELASIQISKLTPAKVFVINTYLQEKTEGAISIDSNGEVTYHKESPYEVEVHPDRIFVYRIDLIPEECRSTGIRLTPVELLVKKLLDTKFIHYGLEVSQLLKNSQKMETKNISTFGKVTFTETGISFEVPYKEPNWDEFETVNANSVLQTVKALVAGRLQHCVNNLEEKFSTNVGSIKSGIIFFKDGSHFSRPAAEAMQRVAESKNIYYFDGAMIAQSIKACINPRIVVDNEVVPATFKESELQAAIDVLAECQVVYQQCYARAEAAGLTAEFQKSMESGCSPTEALAEWDI